MEYVDGPTLGRELSSEPLRPRRAVEVIAAVASALEHAHEAGIVHRDVKPANVLLGRGGVIKLADLGIATAADHTRITSSGAGAGHSLLHGARAAGGPQVTPATDIYALATVAFETLTGRKARAGRLADGDRPSHLSRPPPDLREAWQHAPAEAADVLRRGMARDPADRPGSACDLASELARALGEETTARIRSMPPARPQAGAAAAAPPARPAPKLAPAPSPEADARAHPRPRRPPRAPPPRRPPRAPPRRPPRPRATRPGSSTLKRGSRLLLMAAIGALAVVVAVVVLASGGSDEPSGGTNQADSIDQGGAGSGSTGGDTGSAAPEQRQPGRPRRPRPRARAQAPPRAHA